MILKAVTFQDTKKLQIHWGERERERERERGRRTIKIRKTETEHE